MLDTRIKTPLSLTSSTLLRANILSSVTSLLNETKVSPTSTVTEGK